MTTPPKDDPLRPKGDFDDVGSGGIEQNIAFALIDADRRKKSTYRGMWIKQYGPKGRPVQIFGRNRKETTPKCENCKFAKQFTAERCDDKHLMLHIHSKNATGMQLVIKKAHRVKKLKQLICNMTCIPVRCQILSGSEFTESGSPQQPPVLGDEQILGECGLIFGGVLHLAAAGCSIEDEEVEYRAQQMKQKPCCCYISDELQCLGDPWEWEDDEKADALASLASPVSTNSTASASSSALSPQERRRLDALGSPVSKQSNQSSASSFQSPRSSLGSPVSSSPPPSPPSTTSSLSESASIGSTSASIATATDSPSSPSPPADGGAGVIPPFTGVPAVRARVVPNLNPNGHVIIVSEDLSRTLILTDSEPAAE